MRTRGEETTMDEYESWSHTAWETKRETNQWRSPDAS
jgi:hypothetical protein